MNAFAKSSSGEAAPPVARGAAGSPIPDLAPNRAWSLLATAAGPLQAKLTVNTPGDPHEQEADQVADQVLRMADPEPVVPSVTPGIQRMCPECEEEAKLQRALPKEDEEQKMQAKEAPGAVPEVGPETEARIGAMQGGGTPLAPDLRGYFEPRLGQNLSAVRLHTDSQAAAAAGEVQARAFTVGPNIGFAAGQFRPETESGKRLLAHELVHTVQQGETGEPPTTARRVQRISISSYADPKDATKDPGRIKDVDIQATDEYIDWVKKYNVVPRPFNSADTVLACKLAIRALRQGKTVNVNDKDTVIDYLIRAKEQNDSAAEAEKLENKLQWVPFDSGKAASNPGSLDSEFAKWLLDAQAQPSATSGKMNCWELVMFGAFQASAITLAQLKAVYARAVDNVKKGVYTSVGKTFEETTKASSTLTFDLGSASSPLPLRGDIVVFKDAPNHACIATGKVMKNATTSADEHEVVSLWTPNGKKVEKTTIEKLALATSERPILFWSAKWDGK